MSDIKWIKLSINVFDDEKFDAIKTLPDSNDIQLAWIKLLCLAGKCNESGFLMLTREIPYTDEMLASRFGMDIGVVQRALAIFQKLDMVDVIDNVYMVSNWNKYQSSERLEDIKEKNRERQRAYRKRQQAVKLISIEGQKCAYCGADASVVEHIIPKSKGGTDDVSNLAPSCKSCNSTKKDKDLADFLNDDIKYSNQLNHALIQSNPKIMAHVVYDEKTLRYSNVKNNAKCSISYSFSVNSNIDNLNYLLSNNIYKDTEYLNNNTKLLNSIKEWMIYKDERKDKYNTESGLSKLLTIVINKDKKYGTDAVVETIDISMSRNWVGIIWDGIDDRVKKSPKKEKPEYIPTNKRPRKQDDDMPSDEDYFNMRV